MIRGPKFLPGIEAAKAIREKCGPRVVLSFSRGKDSIGAYLLLREVFDEVIPVHQYLCPGLSFVDESLAYYEKVFGRHIHNVPSPRFYDKLNEFMFMTPGHAAVVRAARIPRFTHLDLLKIIAKEEGLTFAQAMTATGVRAADSPIRRLAMEKYGPINWKTRTFHPVWDWKKDQLRAAIAKSGISLPVDYEMFGRSLDGLDLRFILPIKKRYPKDYERLLEFFPLLDAELWRYEFYGKTSVADGEDED